MRLPLFRALLATAPLLASQAYGEPPTAPRAISLQAGGTAALQGERRSALVIGNAAYREAPLRNPVNDAQAMAATLRGCGFQVDLVLNADRATLYQAVRTFGRHLEGGGVGLLYFAGHGMAVKGVNYLIPVAADIDAEDEVEVQALAVQSVLNKMEAAKNRLNIVILDACRNNPFGRGSRSGDRGLAQMDAPTGTFIAYATAPGSVGSDGDGSHGLYTEHLLAALTEPGLKVEEVFKRVRVSVKRASKDQQVPWDSSSLTGDFIFKPASPPPAPVTIEVTAPAAPTVLAAEAPRPEVRAETQARPPQTLGEWITYQTDMDRAMEGLKGQLARRDLDAGTKVAALEAALQRWSDDNPYSDKDKRERSWLATQAAALHRVHLQELAAQQDLSPGRRLEALEAADRSWSQRHPEADLDARERAWLRAESVALRLDQMKAFVARNDVRAEDKLGPLEEAAHAWFAAEPLTAEEQRARDWLRVQATTICITQSATVGIQAKRTLSEEGFATWRAQEQARLVKALAGTQEGDNYLSWLATGEGRNQVEWQVHQAEMDQAVAQLKLLLARGDLAQDRKLAAVEAAQGQWYEDNPYAQTDKLERAWLQDQAWDLRMGLLRTYLASPGLKPAERMAALDEAARTWFGTEPLPEAAQAARSWIRNKAAGLRITESVTAATAQRTLGPVPFAAWRDGERARLALPLAGTPSGAAYLAWLATGQGEGPGPGEGITPGESLADASGGLNLVWIPEGSFLMGSAQGDTGARPVHKVRLSHGFWLGRTDVTVAQFRRFAEQTGYRTEAETSGGASVLGWSGWAQHPDASWRHPYLPQGEDHPVVCVTWNDAQAYVRWLNTQAGGGYRLPTEAEWEFACRAGEPGATYGAPEAIAWYHANSDKTTHPAGQKAPNAFGLQDLLGNVWQWCQDRYGPYAAAEALDPAGPASGPYRILRGAGWNATTQDLDSGKRTWNDPRTRSTTIGFRVARSIAGSP